MKLLEKLLANTGELVAAPYLKAFADRSPDNIMRNSLKLLDHDAIHQLNAYIKSCFSETGGFCDRAGKADLYYTLFGYFIAKAFDMEFMYPAIEKFVQQKIKSESLSDVHLHCAAIITASASYDILPGSGFKSLVKQSIRDQLKQRKIYNAFLSLMTCYYTRDYSGIYVISKYLGTLEQNSDMPCTLAAAGLVLQKTFNRPTGDLKKQVLSHYNNSGGFKATRATRAADLLSTAVALYSLSFAGADLRMIRPGCLDYIDSLFHNGGFCANPFDPDTDIEYTFYGLLAMGALAT